MGLTFNVENLKKFCVQGLDWQLKGVSKWIHLIRSEALYHINFPKSLILWTFLIDHFSTQNFGIKLIEVI